MTSSAFAEVSAAFPWFFPAVAFIFGACVGSFLNVVIYRLPKEQSVVTPGSHCGCGQPIRFYDNIPILSWLILRGRARCCGRAFSFRYPFVELLTGLLFTVCWLHFPPVVAVCGWIFVSCLVAATFIDLDHMIIPDVFTIGLGVLGVFIAALVPALHGHDSGIYLVDALRGVRSALLGLLIGSGLVLWIALIAEVVLRKEAMGFGDVKFVGAIGAFCGWQGAVFTIFGGAVVGTVWFAIAWAWEKTTGRRAAAAPPSETPEGEAAPLGFGAHIPFGPMLAIAGGLYFLFFRGPVLSWMAEMAQLF
ncbi:MAG: prepilin peptidase [Opitutaceae bacterium]|nr:prepilin peptidase [Opitutaceae bacterium]